MSMISELTKQLRKQAFSYKWSANEQMSNLLTQAADTIEALSAKLSAANMERSERYYGGGWIACSE
ncbi:MAG: hypothetical protein NC548_54190 [Lachnospiraceae bacterium]|nr:hypothetical protein [Lachnospiraceae bacterium]